MRLFKGLEIKRPERSSKSDKYLALWSMLILIVLFIFGRILLQIMGIL